MQEHSRLIIHYHIKLTNINNCFVCLFGFCNSNTQYPAHGVVYLWDTGDMCPLWPNAFSFSCSFSWKISWYIRSTHLVLDFGTSSGKSWIYLWLVNLPKPKENLSFLIHLRKLIWFPDAVTLFAPTNEAIANAGEIPEDELVPILTFHAIDSAVDSSAIEDELMVSSVNGASIRFNIYDESTVSKKIKYAKL